MYGKSHVKKGIVCSLKTSLFKTKVTGIGGRMKENNSNRKAHRKYLELKTNGSGRS